MKITYLGHSSPGGFLNCRYFNSHSHRKSRNSTEFVCRNAFHILSERSLARLPYPVPVGIHPWHSGSFSPGSMEKLRCILSLPNVLAIGEIGLDRRNGPALEVQMRCWEKQFQLAQDSEMPMIIHCVRAWQDVLPLVRISKTPLMFHDFQASYQLMESLAPFPNIFFSFGKSLFTHGKTAQVFQQVPAERLLLETDQSGIGIEAVYRQASLLRGVEEMVFCLQMKKNSLAFFGEKALPFF